MALSVTCTNCRAVTAVPDDAAGTNVRCATCGAALAVRAAAAAPPRKVCCVCGTDVSGRKRTKDARGRYFCEACWAEQVRAGRAAPVEPLDTVCTVCGVLAGPREYVTVDNRDVCKSCHAAKGGGPATPADDDAVLSIGEFEIPPASSAPPEGEAR